MAQCVICMLSMHAAQSKGGKDEQLTAESLKLVVMHLLSLATVCSIMFGLFDVDVDICLLEYE